MAHQQPGLCAPEADLAARQPVWIALSELYLDTDAALGRSDRARALAESPYSIAQLETILAEEVHPVCWINQHVAAGVWDGFDPEWLKTSILQRQRSPFRVLRALRWWRPSMLASEEWQATRQAILGWRAQGANAGTRHLP